MLCCMIVMLRFMSLRMVSLITLGFSVLFIVVVILLEFRRKHRKDGSEKNFP